VLVVDVKLAHPLYIAQKLTYFVNLLVFEINLCATTTAAAGNAGTAAISGNSGRSYMHDATKLE